MKLSLAQLKSVIASYVDENKISVDSFQATKDNTVGLLDKVGKIFSIETSFVDKLGVFDGEDLSFGKTVEEWAYDLILPETFRANGSEAMSPHDSTYRPVYYSYTLGRKVIPQTIRNDDIERAVHNVEQFSDIIAKKTKAMYDSETMLRYGMKREALGVLAIMCENAMDSAEADYSWTDISDNWATDISSDGAVGELVYIALAVSATYVGQYIIVKPIAAASTLTAAQLIEQGYLIKLDLVSELALPVDNTTGENFIEQVKKDVEIASDFSEGHSLNGNTLGASEGLILVTKQGIAPALDVRTLAGAFHQEKVALPVEMISIPDFGSASSDVYAILLDRRGVKLHSTYRAVRENFNGDGDFLNMFYHTENTVHVSRNIFVKVYKKPA